MARGDTLRPQQFQRPSGDVGTLTQPICAQSPHERLIGTNGPLDMRSAYGHARLVLRLAPWKMIDLLEKPRSRE